MRRFAATAILVLTTGLAIGSTQSLPLARVMRSKLDHSEHILEAVVTSNWKALDEHSRALQALTKDPAWSVLLMTPEYTHYTKAFIEALDGLIDAARTRDLDKTPAAYTSLTLSCVNCHRYVARARIAKR